MATLLAALPSLLWALEPGERAVGAELIGGPVTPFVLTVDLRDLQPAPVWRAGDPLVEIPRGVPGGGSTIPAAAGAPDPLVELQRNAGSRQPGRAFEPVVASFPGQSNTGSYPPDPVGDIGRGHYVQSVNSPSGSRVVVYSLTGDVLAGPFLMDGLGSGVCAAGRGDPTVLYDRVADRWLLQEFSSTGNTLCVYVSQGRDPVTSGWYAYQFVAPTFPDYPHLGVWPDAYYVSTNENTVSGLYAFDRLNMLAGATARPLQRFAVDGLAGFLNPNPNFNALTPADLDGDTLPPAGARGIFMRHHDEELHSTPGADAATDRLEVYTFAVDWDDSGGSVLERLPDVTITDFNSYFGSNPFSAVPQPGGAVHLDAIREVVLNRLQYRRFTDRESLVGVIPTNLDASLTASGVTAALRWFELRRPPGGDWMLHQEGTFHPGADTENRFVGAVAMDGAGNLALAYSFTDTAGVPPSLKITGRDGWTGSLGVMTTGEQILVDGAVPSGTSRWGDYAAMSVDPVDDRTFWFTGEYIPTSDPYAWGTWIAAMRLEPVLFADDFEAGTLAAWSHVEP